MTFYDLNVTKPIIKSNGAVNLGAPGTPNLPKLTLGGILDKVGLITQGTAVFTPGTGTIAQDGNGPYNLYTNISLIPNQQVPIVSTSGYGLWLFDFLQSILEADATNYLGFLFTNNLPTLVAGGAVAGIDPTWLNTGNLIATPSGNQQSTAWTFPLHIPVTQRMFNGIVGWWELGNPLAQVTVSLAPGYINAASPFNIYSLNGGAQPYLVTGNSTITLASPICDVIRYLYDTPVQPQDRPPVTFINTVIEDTFQQSVGSAAALTYTFAPLSGYIARAIMYVTDQAAATNVALGVAGTKLLPTSSIQFSVGDGTVLISESIWENVLRQSMQLRSSQWPQGAFFYDFLGQDLTFQNVMSTYDQANIKMALNFSSAVGAASSGKVVRQMLKPLQYVQR